MSTHRKPETVVEGLVTINSTLRRIAYILEAMLKHQGGATDV